MRALLIAVVTLTLGVAAPASSVTVTLSPVADTYLRSGAANSNEGLASLLRVRSGQTAH